MTRKLIILGTGGNCLDILDAVFAINNQSPSYTCTGFLDDDPSLHGREICGLPVLGPLASAADYGDCVFVNGIGSPKNYWMKKDIVEKTRLSRDRFETIVHPSAVISNGSALGMGTVVLPNVTVSRGARLGDHVMVLPGVVVSHDTQVGDYSCIASGAVISGNVSVGDSCYLGANCSIHQDIIVGNLSMVGMGSVLLEHVPPNTVVCGVPARFLRATQ